MDTYRGGFPEYDGSSGDERGYEHDDDEVGREAPPSPVGQDERRMQVRAYNYWASLLDNRNFPSIEDIDPENLPDFGPYSVLLDFTGGIENPAIQFLGGELAKECGAEGPIQELSDVPSRSLLSRITDHYMQILANQAPIGFEAEFVNQRSHAVLYRGILLPFSSDDDTIDFIYGVINWKELADQATADELLLEIDQALQTEAPAAPVEPAELAGWDDSRDDEDDGVLDLTDALDLTDGDIEWPEPAFGAAETAEETDIEELELSEEAFEGWEDEDSEDEDEAPVAAATYAPLVSPFTAPVLETTIAPAHEAPKPEAGIETGDGIAAGDMGLADWLASARELAQAAQGSEDRSRNALYAAIGRAYDFSIAAAEAPEEFEEIVADAGLTTQDRAPMTPVVKLVFGAEYDKTRLTEYAAALGHAHRLGLGRGSLTGFLASAPGGLKGVVYAERRLRREESGKPVEARDCPREALARKLRKLDHRPIAEVDAEGSEFALLVARRLPTGEVVLLGEVADVPLLERAARQLLG